MCRYSQPLRRRRDKGLSLFHYLYLGAAKISKSAARERSAHAFRLYPRPCCCLCNYFSWCINFSWALLRNGLLKHIIFHGVLGKCQMFAFMRGKKSGLQKLATSNSANCVCSILFPLNEAAVQIFSTKFLSTLLRAAILFA